MIVDLLWVADCNLTQRPMKGPYTQKHVFVLSVTCLKDIFCEVFVATTLSTGPQPIRTQTFYFASWKTGRLEISMTQHCQTLKHPTTHYFLFVRSLDFLPRCYSHWNSTGPESTIPLSKFQTKTSKLSSVSHMWFKYRNSL